MSNRQLLCIHYYFPPFHSISSTRNHSISGNLCSYFDTNLVLCSSNRNLNKDLNESVTYPLTVRDCYTLDYRTLLSWFRRKKSGPHKKEAKKKSAWFVFGMKFLNSFPVNIFFGEGGIVYFLIVFFRSVRFASNQDSTLIYTSFRPYSDLFCAFLVKTIKRKAIWVLDFRDLPYDPLYKNALFPKYERMVLKTILKKTDLITTVSKGLAERLKYYNRPVHTLYSGVEIIDQESKSKLFTISYTGSFYLNYRDPSFVFGIIRDLIEKRKIDPEKIQIVYAGKDGESFNKYIEAYNLNDIAINFGLVERKRAREIQMSSHINLLVTSSTHDYSGILTGKLFEYLGVNTHILALINGPSDPELNEIVQKSGSGLVVTNSAESESKLRSWLLIHYNNYLNGYYELNKDMGEVRSKYNWSNNTRELLTKAGIGA